MPGPGSQMEPLWLQTWQIFAVIGAEIPPKRADG
jgi:hypothetical protein